MRIPAVAAVVLVAAMGCGDSDDRRAAAPVPATPAPASSRTTAPAEPERSASPQATARTASTSRPTAPSAPAARAVRLTGDGIDLPGGVMTFGQRFDVAAPALEAALGEPTLDTGEQKSFGRYGTCPGTRLRALEFGAGALYVLFGDVDGPQLTMYQWSLTQQGQRTQVPAASALVGDAATFAFRVGDTLGALRAGTTGAGLDVRPGDEIVPPTFRLEDQSSGFFGYLTGTRDADTITGVLAGRGCGE